jgi:hypothetical protein
VWGNEDRRAVVGYAKSTLSIWIWTRGALADSYVVFAGRVEYPYSATSLRLAGQDAAEGADDRGVSRGQWAELYREVNLADCSTR